MICAPQTLPSGPKHAKIMLKAPPNTRPTTESAPDPDRILCTGLLSDALHHVAHASRCYDHFLRRNGPERLARLMAAQLSRIIPELTVGHADNAIRDLRPRLREIIQQLALFLSSAYDQPCE